MGRVGCVSGFVPYSCRVGMGWNAVSRCLDGYVPCDPMHSTRQVAISPPPPRSVCRCCGRLVCGALSGEHTPCLGRRPHRMKGLSRARPGNQASPIWMGSPRGSHSGLAEYIRAVGAGGVRHSAAAKPLRTTRIVSCVSFLHAPAPPFALTRSVLPDLNASDGYDLSLF